MYENLKKRSIKVKKKQKMRFVFLKVCLIELDQGKIVNCVPNRIFQSSKTIFATILCRNKTVVDGLNLLVSVSKFGIDTTKNRWYRIGIVSI